MLNVYIYFSMCFGTHTTNNSLFIAYCNIISKDASLSAPALIKVTEALFGSQNFQDRHDRNKPRQLHCDGIPIPLEVL